MSQLSIQYEPIITACTKKAEQVTPDFAEVWKSIPGTKGFYEVSNYGRIRSTSRYVAHGRTGLQFVPGKMFTLQVDRKGYYRVVLPLDGKKKYWAAHRAVMCAFKPIENFRDMQVNHIDGNPKNNLITNLEWCTSSENRIHSYRVLKTKNPMQGRIGALNKRSLPVIGTCLSTGVTRRYASKHDCAVDGFDPKLVLGCITGSQKSHKGWSWSFDRTKNDLPGGIVWGVVHG